MIQTDTIPIINSNPLPRDPILMLCLAILRQAQRDGRQQNVKHLFDPAAYRMYITYIICSFPELKHATDLL